MTARPDKPNLYAFTDYRAYLKAFYAWKKRENPSYSYRLFSRTAGLSSDNHLWQVITGRKSLGNGTIRKFAKGLKLKKRESAFFENLVLFNQAKTNEEKNHYYQRLASSKGYIEVRHIEKDQYEYLSKWYFAAVREMVLLPTFREDPKWIAARLTPRISTCEATEAMELLFRLGLWTRTDEGRIVQSERHLGTVYEVASLAAANFHHQMIEKARESIDRSQAQHRDISALTVAVSKEKIAEVKRRIHAFKRELHAFMAEGEAADVIYQLNLQLFNLSEVPDET